MTCAALITAAGHGKRMGANVPKQYLNLEGVPVLVRTVLAFTRHPMIQKIVLTIPPGEEDHCRNSVLAPFGLNDVAVIVSGGAVRQASVYNGLKNLTECTMVVIHDGVRPLVSSEVITRTIKAAQDSGAAVACIPVRETVKKKNGSYLETISRSNLWLAHTPQTFHTRLIIRAHEKALEDDFTGTDDAALVERMGHPVTVVEDSRENIKITTPQDLELASVLLLGRERFNGCNISRTF
jgi:2-C-methyl-D-erythritol 4-phosphate cytidylyltransferase